VAIGDESIDVAPNHRLLDVPDHVRLQCALLSMAAFGGNLREFISETLQHSVWQEVEISQSEQRGLRRTIICKICKNVKF
jgi:hypothetical protein